MALTVRSDLRGQDDQNLSMAKSESPLVAK